MHPATAAVLRYFEYSHLSAGPARDTSGRFYALAHTLAATLPADPETTVCLRKLLEAKDAGVRAALELLPLADVPLCGDATPAWRPRAD